MKANAQWRGGPADRAKVLREESLLPGRHDVPRTAAVLLVTAAVVAALGASAPAAFAADQADFQAAYAAAEQAEQQAGTLRDRWTPTETALKQAKQAADAKHYDAATALAREAEALAKISIEQARAQDTAWRDAVVR